MQFAQDGTNAKCSDVRYLVAIRGKTDVARTSHFCRFADHTREAAARSRGARQRSLASHLRGSARLLGAALGHYCARNLHATIRATMLAKISSAGRDFRIIGLVEWRAADRPG